MILQVLVTFDGREPRDRFLSPQKERKLNEFTGFHADLFTMISLICNHYQPLATKKMLDFERW